MLGKVEARPVLHPIPIHRRLSLHSGLPPVSDPLKHVSSFAARRFCSHISGLERFSGLRVLEIGGTDRISMEEFFLRNGAEYQNIRLEANPKNNPRVISGDFMGGRGEFDLIISLGVFELGAIDINFETSRPVKNDFSLQDRINKLGSLSLKGGYVVIGTINAPCLFDSKMIRDAGFEIIHRESPFYSFMFAENRDVYAPDDRSELLILRKR